MSYYLLSLFAGTANPVTGDRGLSPIIIVLIIVAVTIVLGCLIWALVLGKKGGEVIRTTKASDTDEQKTEHNIVEPIENNGSNTDNEE